jgi:hypothetical protein
VLWKHSSKYTKKNLKRIFRQDIHFVDIFQIEETKKKGKKIHLHNNMGEEAESKYVVVSLAFSLFSYHLSPK